MGSKTCRIGFAALALAALIQNARPASGARPLIITPRAAGPFHVAKNRILDPQGRAFLVRGTTLPPIPVHPPSRTLQPGEYEVFSGTTFVTIRQRLNMNAVRLVVDGPGYIADKDYRSRVRDIVRSANALELLVILDGYAADSAFWTLAAQDFRATPNLFFAVSGPDRAKSAQRIRARGAQQPIVLPESDAPAAGVSPASVAKTAAPVHSGVIPTGVIYQAEPHYASLAEDQARIAKLSERVPVLADGLDPHLETAGGECAAFPHAPEVASSLIESILTSYDKHAVSWTISTIEPAKMLDNYIGYDWTKLDNGWECGQPASEFTGIAIDLLSHLWYGDSHGLFTVNQPGGGMVIARGANASTYGRTLAAFEEAAKSQPFPTKLGGISIRVTDTKGVARLGPMIWTGAGWSSLNFLVPAETAPGPAEVAVVREDGSETSSNIVVKNVAPALWTAGAGGRGPVIGEATQQTAGHAARHFPIWEGHGLSSRSLPIPLSAQTTTTVRLDATGIRYATSAAAFKVTIGDLQVPVISFEGTPEMGRDHVTVRLPASLRNRGETDMFMTVEGVLSNVVRINLGSSDATSNSANLAPLPRTAE